MLGIVLYERTIAVCEVEHSNSTFGIRTSACYELPEGQSLETLSSRGAAFKAFLKDHGFKARKAVVGIPVKQMMTTLLKTPLVKNPDLLHETIQLNLERKIEADLSDIAFDYDAGQDTRKTDILVTMVLKQTISQIKGLLEFCRITPIQITNTSLGLDLTAASPAVCHIIEYPSSLELCLFMATTLSAVHHLAKPPGQGLDIETAHRIVRLINQTLWTISHPAEGISFTLWTFDSLTEEPDSRISTVFGNLDYRRLKKTSDDLLCNFAAVLATRVLEGRSVQIDYLHSRHGQPKSTLVSRWLPKAAIAAAGILLLVGGFLFSWQLDRKDIIRLIGQLDSMKDNVAAATEVIDQVSTARQWFQSKPVYLEILRELTLSFPVNSDIWLTSLAVDESRNQVLTGRAVREEAVLDVADALRKKTAFDNVKILYIRKMGKGTDIMTFAISLHCREDI
jgi:hypothetical protein